MDPAKAVASEVVKYMERMPCKQKPLLIYVSANEGQDDSILLHRQERPQQSQLTTSS